ncbi:MAG TPA: hypothetical protein VEV17_04050 [Bryobacteraceae bacterium]|nr:hypothetical protein [Bryobacteraceae bacterium]
MGSDDGLVHVTQDGGQHWQNVTPNTLQSTQVYEELASLVNVQLEALKKLVTADLATFNKLVHEQNVPAVIAPLTRPLDGAAR